MNTGSKCVLLIQPPVSLHEIYGGLAEAGAETPPLNLLLLAAIIREKGYDPHILDCAARHLGYGDILEFVDTHNPVCVGLTAMTPHIMQAGKVAESIRARFPATLIALGGAHITCVPEATMERFSAIDIGFLGESDHSLPEFLDAYTQGKDFSGIHGLILRKADRIERTPPRKERVNLDTLPMYAWDILEGFPEQYKTPLFAAHKIPATPILTSRGCPGKCTYCFSGGHKTLAAYSAEKILTMLMHLKNIYGIQEFMIYDDNFVMYKKNLHELLDSLIEVKLNMSWSCNARVDMIDEILLNKMAQAGCWQISYGIETGNDTIMESLQKKITKDQIQRALLLTKKAGIRTVGYFMIGHFGETQATIEETIQFACSCALDDMRMSFFTPLPGTAAYPEAHKYGEFDDDWGKMTLFSPVFIPHGFTKESLIAHQKRVFRRFFLRPRIMFAYLKFLKSPANIFKAGMVFLRYMFKPS